MEEEVEEEEEGEEEGEMEVEEEGGGGLCVDRCELCFPVMLTECACGPLKGNTSHVEPVSRASGVRGAADKPGRRMTARGV